MLADTGYAPDKHIISAYKNPVGGRMTDEQNKFNYQISHVRIAVEHAIGILKERFQSLKELRLRIRGKDSMKYTNLWIRACFVLHNILVADFHDEDFLRGEDLQALEVQWRQQAQQQEPLPRSRQSTLVAGVGQPAEYPVYRSALLEDAVTRKWKPAYEELQ